MTDTTVDATLLETGAHVLESIMRTDAPLLTLETAQPDRLVEQFRTQVRHSGEAVYVWREGDGLRSLRETGVRVPGCLRLVDTLRYVLKSMHFGIYVVSGVSLPLTQTERLLLRRIAHTRTEFVRRVVLLGDDPVLAQRLGKLSVPLKYQQATHASLRLRDGRWVH
ncbi:MAG TPA: hypothetical protein VFJ15_03260 [Oleiagrimonas sp.]|nr:hypothetical protein [Oleiagrimonas sp.]